MGSLADEFYIIIIILKILTATPERLVFDLIFGAEIRGHLYINLSTINTKLY